MLREGTTNLTNRASIAQPLITALQIALVNLLLSWKVSPVATVGHSSGEIAAAYVAGRISMECAIVTAFLRGKAVAGNQGKGAMLVVGTGVKEINTILDERFQDFTMACHNSPQNVTLSGNETEISEASALLKDNQIFTKLLTIDGNAYHSSHMKNIGPHYETQLAKEYNRPSLFTSLLPKCAFISSVTGLRHDDEALKPQYWGQNLKSVVLFHEAMDTLSRTMSPDFLIELGPYGTLRSAIEQISKATPGRGSQRYIPALIREKSSTTSILTTAGNLWAAGHAIDIEQVNAVQSVNTDGVLSLDQGKTVSDLPRYQWQYDKPLKFENRWTKEWRLQKHARYDILGSRILGLNKNMPTWRNVLTHKRPQWLSDHRVRVQFFLKSYVLINL